jgi:exonuclease III
MSHKNCNVLCWNVDGLNAAARRDSVRVAVSATGATIVCLQETKIANWTTRLVRDTLGPLFANNFTTLPAQVVHGGILLEANEHFFGLQNFHTTDHTVSADVVMCADNVTWTVTGVYGPQENDEKGLFLDELKNLKASGKDEWLDMISI